MAQGRYNNNFDLLRILAALQVALVHAAQHLEIGFGLIINLIGCFPGVPVFFVISGYLVSESLSRSDLRTYFMKRAARIYPGLWACLVISVLIASASGVSFATQASLPWLVAQATVVQFWNPDFLRDFGVGVLNGSLWTIPVELQFYLLLPALALVRTRALILTACAFIAVNWVFVYELGAARTFWEKLAGVTLPPYLFMFLIGMLLQRRQDLVRRFLAGKLPWWLLTYLLVEICMYAAGAYVGGNYLNPLSAVALGLLVISAAHTRPVRLPGDFSYGLYLYHMPVFNAFIEAGATGSWSLAWLAILASFVLACGSWFLIERPALRWSNRARTVYANPL